MQAGQASLLVPLQGPTTATTAACTCSAILQGPGKKWEHMELNANGKPQRVSMHVRLGDTVKVR